MGDLIILGAACIAALVAIYGTVWCWSDYRRIAARQH